MSTNWIAPYNRLFILLDTQGPTYHGGSAFLRLAQQVDQDVPSYRQSLDLRQQQGKSNLRRDFYRDIFQGFNDDHKCQFFRLFITVSGQSTHQQNASINSINIDTKS